jgi:hypothetical protein
MEAAEIHSGVSIRAAALPPPDSSASAVSKSRLPAVATRSRSDLLEKSIDDGDSVVLQRGRSIDFRHRDVMTYWCFTLVISSAGTEIAAASIQQSVSPCAPPNNRV